MIPESGQIVIVFAEPQAVAAQSWFGPNVVRWPLKDLRPLAGRSVVIWPDNSPDDVARAGKLAPLLIEAGADPVKIVGLDPEKGYAWGPVDADMEAWDQSRVKSWMRERVAVWTASSEPEFVAEREQVVEREEPPPADDTSAGVSEHRATGPTPIPVYLDDCEAEPPGHSPPPFAPDVYAPLNNGIPFRILGFNHGIYYFQSNATQQLTEMKPNQMDEANLTALAPLEFWEHAFESGKSKSAFGLSQARNALMRKAESTGIFTRDRVRGRGAWLDKGVPVVHFGPWLLVDGARVPVTQFKSSYVYENEPPLDVETAEPATTAEAHRLVELLDRVTWADNISGQLLAGFCVAAPVCGALGWASNCWVSGPSQSGKTTVKNIALRAMGEIAIKFAGATTEPGIRRKIGFDARPSVLDEFESESRQSADIVRQVLGLARVASDKQTVTKADPKTGGFIDYPVNTCFLAVAINPAIAEYADARRWTMLNLRPNFRHDREDHYKGLVRDMNAWMPSNYAAKMFARTVKYLPVLLENVKTFTDAAATTLKNRGAADQLGMMLGGLHLCHSTQRITYDDAMKWIASKSWGEHTAAEGSQDEFRLLSVILSATRRINTGTGTREISVGEMIDLVSLPIEEDDKTRERREMESDLGRMGIRILPARYPGFFVVANKSPPMAKILKDTAWVNGWRAQLKNLPGAQTTEKTVHFSPALGQPQQGVCVPLSLVTGHAEPELDIAAE